MPPQRGDSWKESLMVINTNVSAQTGARLLSDSSSKLARSLARLSSGSKIVSPEDDAAGMSVSMRFDAQLNRLAAVGANVGNAISFSQTQDGFLQRVGKALDRMSELATLSQDVTKTDDDRKLYNQEFGQLQTYVTNISSKNFNGISLFTSTTLTVTIDSDPDASNGFDMTGIQLGAGTSVAAAIDTATVNVNTTTNAISALSNVKKALSELATDRAQIGANIARLNNTSEQIGVLKDNLAAANSRIKDVDVADESTQFARFNILVQAGTSMLAQANQTPQSVLKLLG